MVRYRGRFIDHVVYSSRKDIDDAIRADHIRRLRKLLGLLSRSADAGYVDACMKEIGCVEKALHDEDGLSFAEIEALEVS